MNPDEGLIAHVSDTALWVATYRAIESERPDALFHDPFARRLAGVRGAAIARAMGTRAEGSWAMVVRTCLLDEMLTARIAAGADTVINLAAGLDARPWRLSLPADLRWYDVDLPDVLAYKQSVLAGESPRCVLETRGVDLTDPAARRALLAEAAPAGRNAVVITEGLLVYLESADVAALARDLAAAPGARAWLTDMASPRLLAYLDRRWGDTLRGGSARMRFAPPEGSAFFAPFGWREAEFRSMWHESLRLGRTSPDAAVWSALARFEPPGKQGGAHRLTGISRLEPIAAAGPA